MEVHSVAVDFNGKVVHGETGVLREGEYYEFKRNLDLTIDRRLVGIWGSSVRSREEAVEVARSNLAKWKAEQGAL